MRIPLHHLAIAAALASSLVATAASAQIAAGEPYFSASGFYVAPTDSDWSYAEGGESFGTDVEWDGGFGLALAFGYGAATGLRGEVEVGYRQSDFDKLKGLSLGSGGVEISFDDFELEVDGGMTTLSLMGNGFFTFEAGRLRPYFGAGLGLARHDSEVDEQTFMVQGVPVTTEATSDDDIVFAYQAMAGVGFELSEGAEVRLGYRYFATADGDFEGEKLSYAAHNFEGGIVMRF